MIRFFLTFGTLLVVIGNSVSADWISIKNDTTQTVIVQESVKINGQVRKCKPLKLAPGEVLREFQADLQRERNRLFRPTAFLG
jgi:hypothetical protein